MSDQPRRPGGDDEEPVSDVEGSEPSERADEPDQAEQATPAEKPEPGRVKTGAGPAVAGPGRSRGGGRWWRLRLPTRSGALIGVLLASLGFALAVQLKSTDQGEDLQGARQEDLVQILNDLDSRKERLQRDISVLNSQKQQISSGEQGRAAALSSARDRADALGILAGTVPAVGPGLSIQLVAGRERVDASVVLDAVEELRGAGAEAMQISGSGGRAVRVVASTSFVNSGSGLAVGSARLSGPYTIEVIGDPDTMEAALNIPGGVVDTVRQSGGSVTVRDPGEVRVTALRHEVAPRYARPVD